MERYSALIELKPGGSRNFFLVPTVDADSLLFSSLARRMTSDLVVFELKPPNIVGRIEDMARSYVDEIQNSQPHGPYLLGGLCAGGNIAYEMALQLSRAGESVELLALLDAVTPQVPLRQKRFGDVLTQARNKRPKYSVVTGIFRELIMGFTRKIRSWAERRWVGMRFYLLQQVLKQGLPWPRYIPELKPIEIWDCFAARYVPEPLCDVPVVLVRAKRRTFILDDTPYRLLYTDEKLGWGAITKNLTVIDVDGGHTTMLQEPFVGAMAAALTRCINDKASSSPTSRLDAVRLSDDTPKCD